MSNLINFLFFVVFFVFAAIDFGTAAKDFSNKRFYWFGFDLVIAIFLLFNAFDRFVSL